MRQLSRFRLGGRNDNSTLMAHIPTQPQKEKPTYWFRAKRYGWGWDKPLTWQGWVAYAIFFGALIITIIFSIPIESEEETWAFVRTIIALDIFIISIAWWKGEPARWRWGKDKGEEK
jgi:hypothetical protein